MLTEVVSIEVNFGAGNEIPPKLHTKEDLMETQFSTSENSIQKVCPFDSRAQTFTELIDGLRQHRDIGELTKKGDENFLEFRVNNLTVFSFPGDEALAHLTVNQVIQQKLEAHRLTQDQSSSDSSDDGLTEQQVTDPSEKILYAIDCQFSKRESTSNIWLFDRFKCVDRDGQENEENEEKEEKEETVTTEEKVYKS